MKMLLMDQNDSKCVKKLQNFWSNFVSFHLPVKQAKVFRHESSSVPPPITSFPFWTFASVGQTPTHLFTRLMIDTIRQRCRLKGIASTLIFLIFVHRFSHNKNTVLLPVSTSISSSALLDK